MRAQGLEEDLLHLFIIVDQSEKALILPETYDSFRALGQNDSLPSQDAMVREYQESQDSLINKVWTSPFFPPGWIANKIANETVNAVPSASAKIHIPSIVDLEKSLGIKISIAMLRTSNSQHTAEQLSYREVYLHSKLMIIDDSFITVGSANLNERSMRIDTEINMATDDPHHAKKLRERIFKNLAPNTSEIANATMSKKDAPDTFKEWKRLAKKNLDKVKAGKKPIDGYLVKYLDMRTSLILAK